MFFVPLKEVFVGCFLIRSSSAYLQCLNTGFWYRLVLLSELFLPFFLVWSKCSCVNAWGSSAFSVSTVTANVTLSCSFHHNGRCRGERGAKVDAITGQNVMQQLGNNCIVYWHSGKSDCNNNNILISCCYFIELFCPN